MAIDETNIVHAIQKDTSPSGARLFKNVRGGMYAIASIKPILTALLRRDFAAAILAAKKAHPMMAGLLAPGASDLIGFMPIIITPEMVGQKIAIFCAIEVKTATGQVRPEQANFVTYVKENGGLAGVARSPEQAREVLKITT